MIQSNPGQDEEKVQEARRYWDQAAASFDDEPDHGLHPPPVLHAWTAFLRQWLPPTSAAVLDVGCGTGSLSVVMAGLGHQVTGIDRSPAMIAHAQAKANAQGKTITFHVMDAARPQLSSATYNVIVCRHLLWALSHPDLVLERWADLLVPHGRMILIEGFWHTGGGLHAAELLALLPTARTTVRNLSDQPDYWGKPVQDERFAVIADF